MARRRKNNDIRLSVIGDLDGMTVGRLRELLEGVPDDTKIEADEMEYYDERGFRNEFFYDILIRRD